MIGQNNHRINREWMAVPRLAKCCPQFVDVFRQQSQSSLRQINREEETASNDKVTTVIGHVVMLKHCAV